MSYSRIRVYYYGDGLSCDGTATRQGVEKKITLDLPKRVIAYGDAHGYSSLSVDYSRDHIIIRGGYTTLMDTDFNGSSSEYIKRITRYEWL